MLRCRAMAEVSLRDRRQALLDRPALRGREFCRAYAAAADGWLSAWPTGRATATRGGSPSSRSAATAAASSARTATSTSSSSTRAAGTSPNWPTPSGTRSGTRASTSTTASAGPSEVVDAAVDDLRVALGLLDARLVWGDARVAEPLLAKATELWRTRARRDVAAGAGRPDGRAAPDPRRPGLPARARPEGEPRRACATSTCCGPIAAYAPLLADYVDLPSLEPATGLLTEIRVELHRSAGRELDRLLLQDQDHIAGVARLRRTPTR